MTTTQTTEAPKTTTDKYCQALNDNGGQCGSRGDKVTIDGHGYRLCKAHQ